MSNPFFDFINCHPSPCVIVLINIHRYFLKNKFICLFIFGYIGSSLLRVGFLQLWRAGATRRCGARASHCGGFSLLRSTGSRPAGFSGCGTRAQ